MARKSCPNRLCKAKSCGCASWYARLEAEGLGELDVEVDAKHDTVSNLNSGKMTNSKEYIGRVINEELSEEARDINRHHKFKSKQDRAIWRMHTNGYSIRQIAAKYKLPFQGVRRPINRIIEEWREKQRQPIKVTQDLIDSVDPKFLVALLTAVCGKGEA